MCFISRDKEVSFSRDSTLDDAVVVLFGGDGADPFFGLNDVSDPADGPDAGVGFPCTQFKLVPEDSAELREDEGGKEKIYRLPPGQTQDLIGFAPWKGQCRDQHVGVKDKPHQGVILSSDFVDHPIHVLFGTDTELLSLQCRL